MRRASCLNSEAPLDIADKIEMTETAAGKNVDNKMPIKTEQQLEKILQYLSEQSECSCRDICMLLEGLWQKKRQ